MLRNCGNGNVLLQGAKREPCRVVEDIKRTLQHLLVKEAQKASDDGCIGMSATDVDMVRVLQQVVLDDTELFQTTERDGSVSAQSCLQLEQAAIPMGRSKSVVQNGFPEATGCEVHRGLRVHDGCCRPERQKG